MSIAIRPATLADVPSVVAIHESAFRGFFLTLLGPSFLRLLYRGFVSESEGCLHVAVDDRSVVCGLLAGAKDPAAFFSALRRHCWLPMGLAMIPGLSRHPLRGLERLCSAVFYRGDRPETLAGFWLISSLGVAADRGGVGVGRRLVEQFCSEARAAGAYGVYLQTDQDDNASTLGFYAKLGFVTAAAPVRPDGRRLITLKRSFAR